MIAYRSSRSQSGQIEYGDTGKMLKVQNIEHFNPAGWVMALFAIGSEATQAADKPLEMMFYPGKTHAAARDKPETAAK